ncbi:MAG TPA: DUF402 domain-containing protein [Pyrinomonadaceae bacterium]|nr:DUF402 domain-containing protein [Pyrinomonadaceae bacterium]
MDRWITVNSLRYDLSVRRSWNCRLIEQTDSLLTLIGAFDSEIEHPFLGRIHAGTISYEFFWFDRWFNVFRFHEPNGEFRSFYCNIAMPPILTAETLDYIDLDIDLIVGPDGKADVLDDDEFEQNSLLFKYPPDVLGRAAAAVREVQNMVREREFPFDTVNDCNQMKEKP